MKKIFLSLLSVSLLVACGPKKDNSASMDVPKGMTAADLTTVSDGRMPVLVNVPDSTTGPLEIIANAQGGADVKVGKNFQMTITEGAGDIAMKKNDITHDDVRKFVKYVVEDPNALVWQWQIDGMPEPEFHFYAIVKAGNKSFEVRDVEGEVFTEKSATQMLDAAKSIREKPAKEKS
jgi:hypothetical protein